MGSVGGGSFNVNSAMPFENATPLSNVVQALLIVLLAAALTVAGSLAGRRAHRPGAGPLRTDSVSFGAMLAGVILMATLLNFFPALMLGPFAEGATERLF